MTAREFRALALALPGAVESSHMSHPDFRVHGKIFATLGYPDDDWGMVKLTPEQQIAFIRKDSKAFALAAGAWGRQGSTKVHLASASAKSLRAALRAAWRNIPPPAKAKVAKTPSRP
jgi:hypothetical protein